MNVKELRIGNYVKFRWSVIKVDSIYRSGVNLKTEYNKFVCEDIITARVSEDSMSPIPLSEEWLIKLGFTTYTINKWDSPIENDDYYHIVKFKGWNFRGLGCTMCKIEYVHQLQNLYFALTGKELEVQS